jgi:RimJ/RimL family protein N-acetyltransferase
VRIETDRLILRKMTLDDAEGFFEFASDPQVTQYLMWDTHATVEESRALLARVIGMYESGQGLPLGVVHKADGKLIGACGIYIDDARHARAEIAYWLSRQYWGQGLTTEAVRAIIAFGFDTLTMNRIQALCFPENNASARVMEKAGMKYEGLLRQYRLIKGTYQDLEIFAILRQDWTG